MNTIKLTSTEKTGKTKERASLLGEYTKLFDKVMMYNIRKALEIENRNMAKKLKLKCKVVEPKELTLKQLRDAIVKLSVRKKNLREKHKKFSLVR